jgi:transposase
MDLYGLTDERMDRLRRFVPGSHGRPRVDDQRVLSGIMFVNRNGLRWREAPFEYGPPKTLHNRWKHWSGMGVFAPDHGRAGGRGERSQDDHDRCGLPEGAPHGLQPAVEEGGHGRLIGRTRGGLDAKLHASADAEGRPIRFFLSAGPVSDGTGATALLGSRPHTDGRLADRGSEADWFKEAPRYRGIPACIPGRRSRGTPNKQDKHHPKRRPRIQTTLARPNDRRRIAMRYDRCANVLPSAIALAATVMFWP